MPRKKILLVDDANTILMVERMLLNKAGLYDLVTAADGKEAVAKAEAERPDLILMDVVMPHMTGFEACREIRKNEATKNIPIIMVTTRSEAENIENGYTNGCTDYITKPINNLELIAKVKNYLGA